MRSRSGCCARRRRRPDPAFAKKESATTATAAAPVGPSQALLAQSSRARARGRQKRLTRIRRFLMHVLPPGFHRIRYYGFLTSQTRAKNIARIRELLAVPLIPIDAIKAANANPEEPKPPEHPCPCCGSRMRIIEIFLRGQQPRHHATPVAPKIRIDTS